MKYKLKINKDLTLEELKQEVENGSRFVVFQYCISILFAITLRRFSPAILVNKDTSISKFKNKYNLISSLFGWWGFPWGPYYTIKSFKINRKGGVDFTEDVMLNITKESLNQREVELKITNQIFTKPSKSYIKTFQKAFLKEFETDLKIKQLIVGLFINTKDGIEPYYVIGLKVDGDYNKYLERIQEAIYTQFYKHTYFEFINLDLNENIHVVLEKQGELIINRMQVILNENCSSQVINIKKI